MRVGFMWGQCGYRLIMKKEKIAYKIRHIRMSDKTWEIFKKKKRLSGKSWNLYLLELLDKK